MLSSIQIGFRSIFNFSGRSTRSEFWPYTGVVIFVSMASWAAVFIPEFVSTFARMSKFAAEHPELATVTQSSGQASISIKGSHPELIPDFTYLFRCMLVIVLLTAILLAAAVTRRLHDINRRGFWGLFPLIFIVGSLLLMGQLFATISDSKEPNIILFFITFLNNLCYLVSLLFLIILLCLKSNQVDNRFGSPVHDAAL
jgi:uncharacterized membrane protein YhaH (DUF805 family)